MPKTWKPVKHDYDVIARMGSAGMTRKMVATALGISPRTLNRHEDAIKLYHKSLTEMVTKVGESAIQKSLHPNADTALICFVLKTRGGWREKKSYVTIDDFEGDYKQKVAAIDDAFREGHITIEEYKMLSDVLNDRLRNEMSVEQINKRLDELEKKTVN